MTPATRLQNAKIKQAIGHLNDGEHVFIEAPTGAGKTRKFTKIAQHEAERGRKVMILSDRQNLIKQTARNIGKWTDGKLSATIGMDGEVDQSGKIVACTVQTAKLLKNELEKYDRVVIDEAHHALAGDTDYSEVITAMKAKNPDLQLIGASATPPDEREKLIPELAKAKRVVTTFEEAIAAKLIDLPKTITPSMVGENGQTISSIVDAARKKSGTDADLTGLGKQIEAMRGDKWDETAVYYMERYLGDRNPLVFADSKREAESFVREAKEQGIDVDFIHSGRRKADNEDALQRYDEGKLRCLVSVDMISEGTDVKADAILILKKTMSKKDYRQTLGRGARSYGEDKPNKSLLLDLGASTYLHGEIQAQAEMNNVRGKLDTKVMDSQDMLPESCVGKNKIWVEVADEKTKAYATAIDGQLIYVVPMEDRYAAFTSYRDRKGHHFGMLAIEGERKGMPSRDAFGKWAEDAVRRNERHLARLVSPSSTDKLETMVSQDWARSANSIARSLEMITTHNMGGALQQQARMQISQGR